MGWVTKGLGSVLGRKNVSHKILLY